MEAFQVYLVYFFIWLIPTIILGALYRSRTSSAGLPPSPPKIPVIGHFHLLAPIPHQALHKLSTRYGPLFHIYLGSKLCLVASSPEMAKEFLKTNEATWLNKPPMEALDYMTYGSQDLGFSKYGPYWKFLKKLCMSELLGAQTIGLLQPVRVQEMESMVKEMLKKAEARETMDVGSELRRLTNNVISRMLMRKRSSRTEAEAGDVQKLLLEIDEVTGKFNISDYVWFCRNLDLQGIRKNLVEVRGRFDNMMDRIIEEHRDVRRTRIENGDGGHADKNLLDILLDISEDQSREIKLSRENIKAFVADVFTGGTGTTALTLEWALAELINHPHIMEKARQEIDSVVGKKRLVEESDTTNLPYLQAIVKETLRLHPPAPLIAKEASEDCMIAGYHIPAKTRVFLNLWSLGRDADYWENALEFKPERFFLTSEDIRNGKSSVDVKGLHFQLLPFGSGRRGCPGMSLALQVAHTTLAVLIQCFEWQVKGKNQNGDNTVSMEEGLSLTLSRAHPLLCVPVARLHPFPSI